MQILLRLEASWLVSPQIELPVFDDNDINYIHLINKQYQS